jgi:nicotinate-nucleotide pyrophosphorylase (carboxylating)
VTEEVRFYEDVARVAGEGFGLTGLGGGTLAALRMAGLDPRDVARAVRAALDEDFAYGPDVTSGATVAGRTVTADVVAREAGVLAGVPVALAVFDLIGGYADRGDVSGTALVAEGERIGAGDAVLRVSGPAPAVLGAERTMLNFLTHLSGIATATRAWADAIEGTGAVVRDTRKTTPGLRVLEKYAVRCGGGRNHRMGLGDAALIKDNHVAAAGGVTAAVLAVQAAAARPGSAGSGSAGSGPAGSGAAGSGAAAGLVVEVECDSLAQVGEALRAGAHFLLLDNMPLDSLREAVAMASGYYGVRLEASGGLRLSNARAVAETGVDYLAVGALTHSSPALDLGLDFAAEG